MSHTLMRCAGAREERRGDGRVRNSEAEEDGVSPSREERREIHGWFIRAGINGGGGNKVRGRGGVGADLSDVLQGVMFISCLV